VLSPVGLDLKEYRFVLVNPGIHVSTREAFATLTPKVPARSLQEIIFQPVAEWKEVLKNDFEEPVFRLYPAIEEIKLTLYQAGAIYASMTGSGSTVFGIFRTDTK